MVNGAGDLPRSQMIDQAIQVFVDLVLTEKFADMPSWMDIDLTVSQVRAIYRLAFSETMTISALAHELGIGKPAASILVQQLVQQGLVQREEDSQDRRRTLVQLTRRGMEMVQGRRDRRETKFRRRLDQMSDEEVACLLRGVVALAKVVRSERSPKGTEEPYEVLSSTPDYPGNSPGSEDPG